ncbi:MAG: hypothetical protein Wins2KO_30510 [Winogradskyella sp.]
MNCKNCHTEIHDHDDYCPSCGARVIRNRLTFKNLFEHISETFFNYDNKLLRTLISLIIRPEVVIDDYVNGVRKRFVNPISFFGLSLSLSGLSLFIIKKFYLEYFDMMAWMADLEIFNNPYSQEMLAEQSMGNTMEYTSFIFSMMIPAFALISWVVFLDNRYNFTEHIVLYMYSLSFYSILSVIFGQIIFLTTPESYIPFLLITYPIMLLYHCYLLKRLFKLSIGQLVLRTILFLVLFFIAYIILGIIVFAFQLITGSINISDFAPKK